MFLVGNGYAPVFTVGDGDGERRGQDGPVPFLPQDSNYTSNGVLKLPDAQPKQLGIRAFLLPTCGRGAGRPAAVDLPGRHEPAAGAHRLDRRPRDGRRRAAVGLRARHQPDEAAAAATAGRSPRAWRRARASTLPDGAGTSRSTACAATRPSTSGTTRRRSGCWLAAVLALAGLTASLFVGAAGSGCGRPACRTAGRGPYPRGGRRAVAQRGLPARRRGARAPRRRRRRGHEAGGPAAGRGEGVTAVVIDEQMAQASNVLIYSAMLVYTGALRAFAIDLSGRGRAAAAAAGEAAPERGLVAAGDPGRPAARAGRPGCAPAPARRRPARPARAGRRRRPPGRGHRGLADLARVRAAPRRRGRPRRSRRSGRPGATCTSSRSPAPRVVTGVYLLAARRRRDRALARHCSWSARSCSTSASPITVLYTAVRPAGAGPASVLAGHPRLGRVHRRRRCSRSAFSAPCCTSCRTAASSADGGRPAAAPRPVHGAAARRPPTLDGLRTGSTRSSFPLWTFTMIAGAIWAERRLGPLLGLGPQGGLVVHHLGGLRRLPARPRHRRLGGPPRRVPGARRASPASCSTSAS